MKPEEVRQLLRVLEKAEPSERRDFFRLCTALGWLRTGRTALDASPDQLIDRLSPEDLPSGVGTAASELRRVRDTAPSLLVEQLTLIALYLLDKYGVVPRSRLAYLVVSVAGVRTTLWVVRTYLSRFRTSGFLRGRGNQTRLTANGRRQAERILESIFDPLKGRSDDRPAEAETEAAK